MRVFCLLVTFLCVSMGGPVFADGDNATGPGDGRLVIEGPRNVGAQLNVTFDMGDYRVPTGQSVAINVDVLESPAGPAPRIVPGYPKTSMVFEVPGRYVLTFRLNQVFKPSCGGVEARELLERTEVMVIVP